MADLVARLIRKQEDCKLLPYKCSQGKLTIGVGRNLEDRGISEEEAEFLFCNDLQDVYSELNYSLPWWHTLNEVRRAVLVSMCFNLGMPRLSKFKKSLAAMESGDYSTAADEMLDSLWARQVGTRATDLSAMMRTGEWPNWLKVT